MGNKEFLIDSLVKEGYLKTPEIIGAFRFVDRADFVRPEYQSEAYGNYPLPIGEGQTISQPLTVAFLLELLQPQRGEKILDVGSGSGWTTALLAHIAGEDGRVIGMERIPEICEFGRENLSKYFPEKRAKIILGDGTGGLPEEAPFDKILAGAAAYAGIPEIWFKQLKIGGRIVAPAGNSVFLFIKRTEEEIEKTEYPGFAFVPLIKGGPRDEPKMKDELSADGDEISFFRRLCRWISAKFSGRLRLKKFSAFLAAVLAFSAAVFIYEIYFFRPPFGGLKQIEISQGAGSRKIAEILKKEGVVRSKWIFVFYVFLRGSASDLKPGNYSFGPVSAAEIARELAAGGTNEISATIPEGWPIDDVARHLENSGVVSAGVFKTAAGAGASRKFAEKFPFLNDAPPAAALEGYLFPDTYRFFRNSDAEKIIEKMLANFDRKFEPELRREISKRGITVFETITISSLIEKEVAAEEDRRIVSGILWKRLGLGIPLQVDATITYLTGKKTTNISREETQIDSPYNTYKHSGLPPGPISNPGLSSIRAAVYPEKTPYLYYLSAPDGRTFFSKNLDEHNAAKAKYLK